MNSQGPANAFLVSTSLKSLSYARFGMVHAYKGWWNWWQVLWIISFFTNFPSLSQQTDQPTKYSVVALEQLFNSGVRSGPSIPLRPAKRPDCLKMYSKPLSRNRRPSMLHIFTLHILFEEWHCLPKFLITIPTFSKPFRRKYHDDFWLANYHQSQVWFVCET